MQSLATPCWGVALAAFATACCDFGKWAGNCPDFAMSLSISRRFNPVARRKYRSFPALSPCSPVSPECRSGGPKSLTFPRTGTRMPG